MTAQTFPTSVLQLFSQSLAETELSSAQQASVLTLVQQLAASNLPTGEMVKKFSEQLRAGIQFREINATTNKLEKLFWKALLATKLDTYLSALKASGCSPSTIKNYRSDINQFFAFSNPDQIEHVFTKPKITAFVLNQQAKNLKASSIVRKLSSLGQFGSWLHSEGLLSESPAWISTMHMTAKANTFDLQEHKAKSRLEKNELTTAQPTEAQYTATQPASVVKTTTPTRSLNEKHDAFLHAPFAKSSTTKQAGFNNFFKHRLQQFILPYLNFALIILFFLGLGFFGYRQFIVDAPSKLAYPSSPVSPSRVLSFQGRLTDTAQNPITTATNMRFYLYDSGPSIVGGTQLWDSTTCSVTPDQDGIFSVGLGSDCGSEIASSVFSEDASVWLQVQIASETLSPRQAIRSVAYAINSETLQGFPVSASESATINTVLVMNEWGQVVLGENSPTLKAVSGTFAIEGQTLQLQTTSGSNGNIILDPDGTGGVNILSKLDLTGYLRAPGATFSATYAGGVPLTVQGGPSGTANIQNWQNSSGSTLAYIDASGNIITAGNIGIAADTDLLSLASNALTVNGTVTATGTINSSGGALQTNGTDRISNGGNLVNIGTTQLNSVTYTWPGADAGGSGYALTSNGAGTLSWSSVATDSNIHWSLANGSIFAKNSTVDLLVGGPSTASAKFKVININTGTPIASISANSGNIATYLTGDGSLATTNRQTLTIGNSSSYDTTGNVLINSNGTGRVGIGTTAPGAKLSVLGTSEQLRLNYDASNYASFSVGSDGSLSIAGTGTAASLTLNPGAGGNLIFADLNCSANANGGALTADASGIISCTDDDSAAGGTSYWRFASGAFSPINDTGDVLIGAAATTSAKFGFLNVNSGTPVASISANSGNIATYVTGDGTLATTNRNNLTIGNSSTYNTTGNVLINPNGTGNVGIGTTAPSRKLHVDGGITRLTNTNGSNLLEFGDNAGSYDWTIYQSSNDLRIYDNNASTTPFALQTLTGNLGIGTTAPGSKLQVVGDIFAPIATFSANYAGGTALTAKGGPSGTANILNIQNSSSTNLAFFDSSGNLTLNAQNTLRLADADSSNYIALQAPAVVGSNLTYTLPGTATNGYILQTDGSGTLTWIDTASTGLWRTSSGAVSPINDTFDLLIGGNATSSAKFAFINVNSGTPTASFSGNLAIAVPTTANPATAYNVFNGGSLAFQTSPGGDAGLSSRLSIANNGDVTINRKLGVGGGPSSSDYLVRLTGDSTEDYSRLLYLTQANDSNEDSTVFQIDNTINLGTMADDAATIYNSLHQLTPTGTFTSTATRDTSFYGSSQDLALSGITIGDSVGTYISNYANSSKISGTPVFNSTTNGAGVGLYFSSTGYYSEINLTPTLTSVADPGSVQDVFGGRYITTLNSSGNANLTSNVYGLSITTNGNLTTTGTTTHYGGFFDVDGTADTNYGIYSDVEDASVNYAGFFNAEDVSATTNYGLYTSASNGTTNYALYSAQGRNYFGDSVGIGVSNPGSKLQVVGDIFAPIATFSANYAAGVPLTIKGGPAGSGNILNIQNSSSTNLAFVDSSGNFTLNAQNTLRLADADSSNYVALQAPSVVGSNLTYVLPGTVTNGYYLQTDGSGTLSWAAVTATNYWQLNSGVLSPFSLTADINLGATASSSAKISLAGSLTRGKALAIFNQTEDQDILAASASGTTRFRLDQNGYVHAQRFVDIANSSYYLDPAATDTSLTVVGKTGLGTAAPAHQLQVAGSVVGKALTVLNETGTNDIFSASASGTTRFTIDNSGNVTIGTAATKEVDVNLYGDLIQQANSDLTAIGTMKDVFVYDTTKDSDGGKWTNSTTSKQLSWYTETKDDGYGDACVTLTDDRCGKSAFPKKAVIVANTHDVIIFDAETNTMWMRFTQTGGTYALGDDTNIDPVSLFALNGVLYVGTSGVAGNGLYAIDFNQDTIVNYSASVRSDIGTGRISDRNTAVTYGNNTTTLTTDSNHINDVHAAVVGGETIIALATDADVVVLHPSKNFRTRFSNGAWPTNDDYNAVWLTTQGVLYAVNETTADLNRWNNAAAYFSNTTDDTPDKTFNESSAPALFQSAPFIPTIPSGLYVDEQAGANIAYVGTSLGLSVLTDTLLTDSSSVKYYTTSYITSEMPGYTEAMYPFNETSGSFTDATPNGNYLEDEVAPTYSVNGVRGTGITFNGTSQHLCSDANNDGTCDNDTGFDVSDAGFAASIWFKHSATITGTDVLIDNTYNSANTIRDGFRIWMDSSGLMNFGIDDDNAGFPEDTVTSTRAYNDNKWHHLVAVKEGEERATVIRLFIDGEEAGTADTSVSSNASLSDGATILSIGSDCSVGANCSTGANFWDGSVDEFMFTKSSGSYYNEMNGDLIRKMYMSGLEALKYRTISVTDATSATSTTIVDTGETWTPNEFVGTFVELTGGTGSGQTRRIVQNTATSLTVSPAWSTTPDTTTDFAIRPNRLYGTGQVRSVAVSSGADNKSRTLYVGVVDDSDGGGVTALKLGSDYVTDLYHGNAGKTDDKGTAWDTSTNYDDIRTMSAGSDVLAIGAQSQYWQEYGSRSLTEKIDDLTNKTTALQTGLSGALTNNHTQKNTTDSTVGYQVMRKGWGAIVATATSGYTETVSYGITYDDTPIVLSNIAGRVTGDIPPLSLQDCDTSSGARSSAVHQTTRSFFTLRIFATAGVTDTAGFDFCYTWLAIGTYNPGAAAVATGGVTPWANGADLAEWYATEDTSLAAGEVVAIDKAGTIKVARSNESYDPAAIGIIATQPALTLGPDTGLTPGYKEDEFSPSGKAVAVALAGRVPVKVTLEGGPIKAGDSLTSSSTPGYAMKATQAGPTIGKAMEDFDGSSTVVAMSVQDAPVDPDLALPEGTGAEIVAEDQSMADLAQGKGVVMAFVNTSWYDPDPLLKDSKDLTIKNFVNEKLEVIYQLYKKMETGTENAITRIGAFAEVVVANLTAGRITTTELFADQTSSKTLATDLISPLASGSGDLVINLEKTLQAGQNQTTSSSTQSALGTLLLKGNLDVTGNATIAGTLTTSTLDAQSLTAQTAYFDQVITASLSAGTITGLNDAIEQQLATRSSRLALLENRVTEFENLKAQTASIVNATVSGTLFAANIDGFKESIATALEEPSLLAKLLATTAQTASPAAGLNTSYPGSASASAKLNLADLNLTATDLVLTAEASFINQYFEVNGNAFFGNSIEVAHQARVGTNLAVGDSLTVNSTLSITGNSISADLAQLPDRTLYIQPEGVGKLSLLRNLVVLDSTGTVDIAGSLAIAGNLTVGDSLLTQLIKPIDFGQPLQVQLASKSGETTSTQESRFEIINELGTPVATISGQGRASFAGGLGIGADNLAASDQPVETAQTSGKAILRAASSEVVIRANKVTSNSLIYVTPQGSTSNQVLYVKNQQADNPVTPENEAQFIVGLDKAIGQDVQFNWWIVN